MLIMESSVYSYIASVILLWHRLLFVESSVNLALHKNTSQSSTFKNLYPSSNAVDGLNKQCVNDGFAHTLDGEYEWWQVDLGEMCEIRRIQIYYRTTTQNRLDGYAIDIIKSLDSLETWQCYKDTDNTIPTDLAPSHICPSLGRYVKFSREKTIQDSNAFINLCELEVYGCPQSRYGNGDCNSSCSVGCLNFRCDPDNGNCNCSSDLVSGDKCDNINCNTDSYLQGDRCVSCSTGCVDNNCNVGTGECTKGCKPSFYGTFCNLNCTQNCYNTSCARDTGQCIGCKVGFYGDKCDKICPRNCKDKVCKQDNGYCTNCTHPYKGNTCTECVDGYFGNKCTNCSEGCLERTCDQKNGQCTCKESFFGNTCNQSCPENCKNNRCNQTTGDCVDGCKKLFVIGEKCNDCVDGYYGDKCTNCSEGCFERTCDKINGQCTCKESFFGNTCNQSCPENCKNNRCNQTTGDCVDGCKKLFVIGEKCNECSDGFYGISCNLTCSKTCNKCIRQTGLCALLASDNTRNSESQTQTTNTGPIIGGVVAVIVVMVIVVVIVLFLKRRRRNSGKENRYENQITFSLPKPDHELKDEQKKSNNTDTVKENVVSVENGNDYCNPSDVYMNLTLTEVSISELSSIISKKTAEREFESEYEKLPKGSKHPTTVGKHPDNKIKNRFLTTFPYDHSRVVLKPISTEQKSDYINANYIDEQYVVLHEALLESFQYTERSLSQNKFLEACNELNAAKPKNKTHVYKEFQKLSALRPVYGIESYDSALETNNRNKNRNQNILAVEKYRPFLMSQHSSRTNFINAVMLPTFRKKCGYFVTHYPLENTVVDFWCLVFDHDSSTVVVLDEISDKDNVLHWYPDDEAELTVDSFQIKKVSGPHINGKVREIEFTVTHQDDEKPVRMLMVRPWTAGRCVPPDKNDLLKLIEMTMTRQTTDSGPVTIVCSDGARCCGLFCTVSNVILNLRIEDEIDVFHTVRQLQIRRPQFITDYEEYKSCYEIVKLFLDSSNIYANV